LTVVGVISSTNIVYASGGNSDQWNSAYATVNSISANGSTTYTTVNTNSANWSNVYTSYNGASAGLVYNLQSSSTQGRIEYNKLGTVGNQNLDLTHFLTTGSPQFTNLTLTGNLSVLGDLTYLNTNVSVTSALSVVNAGSGPALYIKQSGTEPIAYFDGVEGGVSSTILFADNGFVGLGTSTPNNRLAVVGVISSTNIVYASGGNSDLWNSTYTSVNANSANGASVYTTTNANSASWSSVYSTVCAASANYILDGGNTKGSNITIGTKDNFNLNLETADTTRVTVTSAGNVGIGTSNPGYLFDLNGNGRITNNLFFGTSSLASMGMVGPNLTINSYAGNPVKVDSLQVTSFQYGVTFQYGDLTLNKSAGVDTYIRSTNQDLRLQSGSTYNLLLNPTSGNVGIGTITPNEKLTVAGVISSSNVVYALGGNSNLWNSTYATVSSLSANNILDGGNTKGANILIGTNDAFNLNLETANATRMTITSAGNVGIGTTSPGYKLQVTGGTVSIEAGAAQLFSSRVPVLTFFRNDLPSTWLNKISSSVSGSSFDSVITFDIATSATTNVTPLVVNGTQHVGIGGNIINNALSGASMVIKSGNVGIGTTSPTNLLHIYSEATSGAAQLLVQNDTNTTVPIMQFLRRRASGAAVINHDSLGRISALAAKSSTVNLQAGYIDFQAFGTPSGFNNILPSKINFATFIDDTYATYANSIINGAFVAGGTTGQFIFNKNDNIGGDYVPDTGISRLSAGKIGIGNATAGTSAGTLIAGNIGIGTTSPTTTLHVVGNGLFGQNTPASTATPINVSFGGTYGSNTPGNKANLKWDLYNSGAGDRYGIGMSASLMEFQAGNSGAFGFYPNAGTVAALTITSGSNVGIGTTSPAEKLDVVGNVKVSGHFSAVTKSFLIDHPTKVDKKLQYGVVESNQHSVLVRGKTAKNIIELPEEWSGLVHEDSVTVQLTPVGTYQKLFVILQDNEKVVVGGVNGLYNYTIYGERKDVDRLQTEI
jgi:hypothetical protein